MTVRSERIAAGCLVGAAVLPTASHFLWPAHSEGTKDQQLTAAATHSTAWAAATWVETIGWLLLVPGALALWRAVGGRGRTLTGVGAWLTVLGVFGYFGAGVMNLVTITLGRQPDRQAALRTMDDFGHSGAVYLVIVPIMVGVLALVALFAGLARAGWFRWWVPAGVFVSAVAFQLLSDSANPWLLTAAVLPVVGALIAAAYRLSAPRHARASQRADNVRETAAAAALS